MRGLLVTGTDTGVGKTILAACLLAALRERGERVAAVKPVLTGLDEPAGDWPADHELLALAAGCEANQVCATHYGPAASPHLAAMLAGAQNDPGEMVAAAHKAASDGETLIAEGVGGLLVPLSPDFLVRDYALALGLRLVIAARPGLGTINHTLLTLAAARGAGLDVAAVVLTPWPADPDVVERSNRETIERLGAVPVHGLRLVAGPALEHLLAAGRELPLDDLLPRPGTALASPS